MDRRLAYLQDILESAQAAIQYLSGKSYDQFSHDEMAQDAIVRRFTIIGEAASRLSKLGLVDWSGLPIVELVDLRNFIVHEYDTLDTFAIYQAIQTNLPELIAVVHSKLIELDTDSPQ